MVTLMTTRFNTETWNERERWLSKLHWDGAYYGTSKEVKPSINGLMLVLEMHNSENKVKAIGLVKAQVHPADRIHQIYEDRNYNHYIYKSKYRLILDHNSHL